MRRFLERHLPPGWNIKRELLLGGLFSIALVLIFSWFVFGVRYNDALGNIYAYKYETALSRTRVLVPGTVMSPFARLVSGSFFMFWVFAFTQIAAAWSMYRSFSAESKSVYLMRRLPKRWELPKRCIPVPLMMLLCGFAVCMLQLLVFRAVYYHNLPAEALPPHLPLRLIDLFIYNIFG